MIAVECADWRRYRRHVIVARKGGLFGLRRYDVWHGRSLLGTFRDVVDAELHVDSLLGVRPAR
jgi:hypothetical protein